jgi:hypothetical protein
MINYPARITLHCILNEMPIGMGDDDLNDCLEALSRQYELDNYGRQTLRQMYEALNYQAD